MQLPFSQDQFFDVFTSYNQSLWPFALSLWAISLASFIWLLLVGNPPHRLLAGLLAFLWIWSALAYHVAFFAQINPAAWGFAALFLVEAVLIVWFGIIRPRFRFTRAITLRHVLGFALIAYALLYPALNLAHGFRFPRMPTFGVPCPTTLLTVGFLLTADKVLWPLAILPACWAIIAGSAAFAFGVVADFALFPAAILLLVYAGRQTFRRGKPCWTIEVNLPQNLLTLRYSGRIGPEQAKQCAEEVQIALAGVKPGFRLLVDLTDLDFMDLACAPHIRNIMEMCNAKGVAEVVRVIPDPKQDIGLQIMSYFHYRGDVHVATCPNKAEAVAILSR